MGKIVNNQYSIETKVDVSFNHNGTSFHVTGNALIEYKSDVMDNYKDVSMPDDGEAGCMKVWMNQVLLKDDGGRETDIFNTVYDYITEILESEITPDKTDIDNDDVAIPAHSVIAGELDSVLESVTA